MKDEGDPDSNHQGNHRKDAKFTELVATQEIKQGQFRKRKETCENLVNTQCYARSGDLFGIPNAKPKNQSELAGNIERGLWDCIPTMFPRWVILPCHAFPAFN